RYSGSGPTPRTSAAPSSASRRAIGARLARMDIRPTLLALLAILPLAGAAPAASAHGAIEDRTAMDDVDARLQRYTGEVPGAALLVLRDGEALVRRGVGLADVAAGTPVTPRTNFRLASLSKQ